MPYNSHLQDAANAVGSLIQSPKINSSGEPTQHSIRDIDQAREIIKTVIQANRNRQIVNARILAKYNAERPYDNQKLEAEGLGWRQNFTTKPLPQMIEKVAPRFTQAVDGLKYLTNSALSNKWQNSTDKTEWFRKVITDCIRGHKGWKTLLEEIAFENSIFGHEIVAWLDEFTWFPKAFKQDESFVTDGAKANTKYAQLVVLKETYLPHELFEQIRDSDTAKTVGYNLENTRTAINNASPVQIRDRLNVGGTLETWYQNAIREMTLGASYMAGASVIVVYSLLAREVTGKISHYRVAGPEMIEIFSREDRFESAENCLAFFSFQRGNGTLHGSKGVGRDIYELAGMLDRSRNEAVDRMILSGKTILQGDTKRLHTFRMSVIGSMVIIPRDWEVLERKIEGNVEEFLKLDAYFSMLVDQLIGSTSPPRAEGEAFRSPAAWNLLAQREEEGQDYRIARFLQQLVDMIGTMQRRICDVDTVEDDAKAAQKKLLEKLTREEIDEIANQPVAGTVKDLTPIQRQLIAMLAAEKRGNPLYNQRALEQEDLSARMDADFAERVLLPGEDPTEQAEQNRLQQFEIVVLSSGQAVPVSPRDNHLVHLQVLMPAAEQVAAQVMSGEFPSAVLEAVIAHVTEHYNQAIAQGVKPETLAEVGSFVSKAGQALAQLKQVDAQAAQLQAGQLPPEAVTETV